MYTPSFTLFSQTASAMRRDKFIIRNFSGEGNHFSFGDAAVDYVSKISAKSAENPVAKSVLDIYIKGMKGNAREFSVEFTKSEIADAFNYFYSRTDNKEVALDLLNHTAFADGYTRAASREQKEAFERYGIQIANSVGLVIESCISDAKAFREMAVSENRYGEYYEIFGDFVDDLPESMQDMINGVSPFEGYFK